MRKLALIAVFSLWGVAAHAGEMLKPGDPFPAWNLRSHTGAKVSSSYLAGKRYLLWFYPKAMTPGCTTEGITLRDNFKAFREAGVQVLGVSFDAPKDNAAFVKEQKFPFRLLSDTERTLAIAVGAAPSAQQATARRISYLIGSDGKVLRAYNDVNPATHAQQVLADLAVLGK